MRLKFTLFFALSCFGFKSFAGAVSAGGLTAPAKVECLFTDPSRPLEPINFIVFDYGSEANPATVMKVDLELKKSVSISNFERVSEVKLADGKRAYFAGESAATDAESVSEGGTSERPSTPRFKIEWDSSRILTADESKTWRLPFESLSRVEILTEVLLHPATISVEAQVFRGVCANQYFIFYSLQ